jgi:hypothetical protein
MRVTCLFYPPREVRRRGNSPDGEETRHLRPPAACDAAGEEEKRRMGQAEGLGARSHCQVGPAGCKRSPIWAVGRSPARALEISSRFIIREGLRAQNKSRRLFVLLSDLACDRDEVPFLPSPPSASSSAAAMPR